MKMRIQTSLALISALCGLFLSQGASAAPPLVNVKDAPVASATGAKLTLAQVQKAIIQSCASKGWEARKAGGNVIIATINVRNKHMAQVEIPFSTTSYSILYKNSENLKYDSAESTIHKNYNSWVQNLNNTIKINISSL